MIFRVIKGDDILTIVIFSIVTGYIGLWVGGLLGATDASIGAFVLAGFLVPTVYTIEKIYDELVKSNRKENN